MCPIKIEDSKNALDAAFADPRQLSMLSGNGSVALSGVTGEPSPSDQDAHDPVCDRMSTKQVGASVVRQHRGLMDISVGSLWLTEECPGTFCALKLDGLGGYMVTLSFGLASSHYAALISMLESTPGLNGDVVSVDVSFEPTTPNLVPQDTAPNT